MGHDGYDVGEASESNPASGETSVHIPIDVSAVQGISPVTGVRHIGRLDSLEHRDPALDKADKTAVLQCGYSRPPTEKFLEERKRLNSVLIPM
jgi:hypothetical protein